MRLSGHTLRAEGAAYRQEPSWDAIRHVRERWNSTSGVGYGVCSCGATSPILDSANGRKQWHRWHKEEVSKKL